ncbi:MAG: polysaccharide export protein [Phormidesmis sp. RL_2_1]|nr:polysaccharide export protein [Phormidesmis sp. RL_2_1]
MSLVGSLVLPLSAAAQEDGALPNLSGQSSNTPSRSSPSSSPNSNQDFGQNSSYVLGPGDRLSLVFFNVPEYNGETQVAIDGSLNLPLIGRLPVTGLTLQDATQAIGMAYRSYLKTPLVTLDLIVPRPIQIGISGEVNQPGAYEISLMDGELGTAVEWPTVIEAIQLAGGITDKANVRQVEVSRIQPGGREQVMVLNLWELLQTGQIQDDITLRHGDAIRIPTAAALTAEELTQLSAANFRRLLFV